MDESVQQDEDDRGPIAAEEPTLVEPPVRTGRRRFVLLAAAAALLLVAGAGGGAIAAGAWSAPDRTTSTSDGTGVSGPSDDPGRWNASPPDVGQAGTGTATSGTAATAEQSGGVVTVVSTLGYRSAASAGTGIVLTSTGRILTNNHVIDGATSIEVTDESTGRAYSAAVVGTDATHDVAVLQLQNASGLATARISATAATVGEAVTAVGNAGGTGTLSAADGTVTALKQAITTESEAGAESERLTGLIETDAAIVSGDSGGPLLDEAGAVIGIDTAASSGTSSITGYAITIASALRIADRIVSGNDTADITLGLPAFLGVTVGGTGVGGAVLGSVLDGAPAAAAGLVPGDTVTSAAGHSIGSTSDLTAALARFAPGDRVTIRFTDSEGDSHSVDVTLGSGPAD